MPEYDPVAKISIIPRGQAGGLTFFAPSEERLESGLYSRSYLENQMAVALGGRLVTDSFLLMPLNKNNSRRHKNLSFSEKHANNLLGHLPFLLLQGCRRGHLWGRECDNRGVK